MKDYYTGFAQIELTTRQEAPIIPPNTRSKRKKYVSGKQLIKNAKTKNHYFQLFRNQYTSLLDLLRGLDQLNDGCSNNERELAQFNHYINIKYFISDFDRTIYDYRTFYLFFENFIKKADLKVLLPQYENKGNNRFNFKQWKKLKKQIFPLKPFNKNLIDKISAQKYFAATTAPNIPNVI